MASMKGFWDGFAKIAVNIGLWAASHPQVILDVVQAAVTKNPASLKNLPVDLGK